MGAIFILRRYECELHEVIGFVLRIFRRDVVAQVLDRNCPHRWVRGSAELDDRT